jgi:urease gamma subunit
MLNDLSGNLHNSTENEEPPNNNDYAIPDKEELFSHINKLINGKIGSLAKEIAEETTKDMNLDSENITDANDVLKGFMKNPTKLLGLISKISNKINSKMKDGSLKESELLEEATNIFKNMKTMPGMENFNEIFKSMNLDQFMPKGSKINPTAFQNMMEQNVKMSKMKERMKKKAETKGETPEKSNMSYRENYDSNKSKAPYSSDNIKLDDLTSNLSSLMEEMKNNTSFIDDIIKKQGQRDANTSAVSSDDNSKRKSNNKRKVNKKK